MYVCCHHRCLTLTMKMVEGKGRAFLSRYLVDVALCAPWECCVHLRNWGGVWSGAGMV